MDLGRLAESPQRPLRLLRPGQATGDREKLSLGSLVFTESVSSWHTTWIHWVFKWPLTLNSDFSSDQVSASGHRKQQSVAAGKRTGKKGVGHPIMS